MNFVVQNAFYCHVCYRSLCVISLQQIMQETQLYITKGTDLLSFWIICWKTIVDFYSLNLWKILSGGLDKSGHKFFT